MRIHVFFFKHTAPTEIYTLSLHDALPISSTVNTTGRALPGPESSEIRRSMRSEDSGDRKSTRLNSSHTVSSYAVFCLKKKKNRGSGPANVCAHPFSIQYHYSCT